MSEGLELTQHGGQSSICYYEDFEECHITSPACRVPQVMLELLYDVFQASCASYTMHDLSQSVYRLLLVEERGLSGPHVIRDMIAAGPAVLTCIDMAPVVVMFRPDNSDTVVPACS